MSKTALTEVMMKGSLLLKESTDSQNGGRKGVLGTISGACADYKHKTRNSNFYPRKLWENAFNDPLIKESMEDRILIGELDHPCDGRLETQAVNSCIVMTSYNFNDKDGLLEGTFDILDTPNGRILKTLLDAGCKIGVSSRGEGDITEGLDESGDKANCVDPSSYTFVGFDAVVLPAVKKAKPALQESFKRGSFKESIERQVNLAKTREELNVIQGIVEAAELPGVDSILESIENKSKEFEGLTESTNLLEDLEKANGQIKDLQEENKELKESLTTCRARVSTLLKSRNEIKEAQCKQEVQNENLRERCKKSTASTTKLRSKLDTISESLETSEKTVRDLNRKIRHSAVDNNKLSKQVENLEESLRESQEFTREQTEKANLYKEQVKALKEDNKNVLQKNADEVKCLESKHSEELQRVLKENAKLQKQLREATAEKEKFIREYAVTKAQACGLEAKTVLESINSQTSVEDVNTLVESIRDRIDRYHAVPLTNFGLPQGATMKVNSNSKKDALTEELTRSKDFMEQAIKQM